MKRDWERRLREYQPCSASDQLRWAILERLRRGEPLLPEIDGREETKQDVIRSLLSGAHPYLVSEEGTGKTRLAKALAKLLPPLPAIRGCPYHDDPKWPRGWLCPRCQEAEDPAQAFGVEIVPGWRRFSRVQGNEYTNEAKLLGLKDIQAIAQGRSSSDPRVFTGTGVFRANRGILFVDELPAIRTKVQVLLHPILEERRAILEEYSWERRVDLVLVATGNPRGFAHVNEVPRPLLDRLELIYMDLPSEEVEKQIMFKERFRGGILQLEAEEAEAMGEPAPDRFPPVRPVERQAAVPWWVVEAVNKAVRASRFCPRLDKRASIRGSNRALDHTCSSAEMELRPIAHLEDACKGLKLALRGRIGLKPEYVDFEDPKRTIEEADRVTEDLLWMAVGEVGDFLFRECPALGSRPDRLREELEEVVERADFPPLRLPAGLAEVVSWMRQVTPRMLDVSMLEPLEQRLLLEDDRPEVLRAYHRSALELLANAMVRRGYLEEARVRSRLFLPQPFREG